MKRLFAVLLLLWPAPGFAQAPAPQDAGIIGALMQENFQNLAQNATKAVALAKTYEATIAKQKAQLDWYAKGWPKSHK